VYNDALRRILLFSLSPAESFEFVVDFWPNTIRASMNSEGCPVSSCICNKALVLDDEKFPSVFLLAANDSSEFLNAMSPGPRLKRFTLLNANDESVELLLVEFL